MEEELFFTGYCRQLDGSRTVTVVLENGRRTECDCCYGGCLYEPACTIAAQIAAQIAAAETQDQADCVSRRIY